ncbi:roadblock/LC7 domain-containing protein [Nocardiopsis sp. ATB16-24]|uniref:roadblock/LC7 domain-containing protein n=1 Tax=Nocardiopsis sp. ATB16-24 TaxID=3019555 RepID=UPI002556FDED|nr:roadblock/LC7 domain-containing protein [Nocardiopsis sp. ATB16-24]
MTSLLATTPVTSPLLSEVLTRLPGARQVVVCTDAGLVHTLAPGADRRQADQLSMLGASLINLSTHLGELGYGRPRRFLTRVPDGWLLIFPIDTRLRAVLVVDGTTKLKDARASLDRLVTRFLDIYLGGGEL